MKPACLPASQPASQPACLPASQPTYLPTYPPLPTYLPAMKINMSTIGIQFAVPRKSARLYMYLSLTLVACDKVRLVDSTVFACSSVVCRAFVALP